MSEELDIASDNHPIRYLEGDTVIYRASSIGACERALVASARRALPQPHPAWFQEVLDEGTLNESVISDMWDLETGIPTVDQQREFNLLIGEIDGRDVYVRSHIDGMNGADPTSIREYKKFRDSTWPNFLQQGVEVGANYPWQVSVAMHALTAELMVHGKADVACEFVGGHYELLNGGGTPDDSTPAIRAITQVECKYIASPPIPLVAIRKKIARVERLINTGFDIMETPCDGKTYPCPYWKYHDPKDELDTRILKFDGEWGELLIRYQAERQLTSDARKVMDSHDTTAKELRARIIERMKADGVRPGTDVTIGSKVLRWTETQKDAYEVKASVMTKVDVLKPKVEKDTSVKTPRKKAVK